LKHVIAIYPGTFDPLTNGHLDLIQRGSKIFDELIVAILLNPEKDPAVFSLAERRAMLESLTKPFGNVRVDTFGGLLVDYAMRVGARAVLRGIRAISDYEYELQMALMNRKLDPRLETVFMMPAETYSYVSSRLVKEIVTLGGSVHGLIPDLVEKKLLERVNGGKAALQAAVVDPLGSTTRKRTREQRGRRS
jgi:pantetheine-phosphate adenylyltransferase